MTQEDVTTVAKRFSAGRRAWVMRAILLVFLVLAGAVVWVSNQWLTERFTETTRNRAELRLALDVIDQRKGEGVADPYHGDDAAFERTWAEVTAIAMAMADEIAAQTKG